MPVALEGPASPCSSNRLGKGRSWPSDGRMRRSEHKEGFEAWHGPFLESRRLALAIALHLFLTESGEGLRGFSHSPRSAPKSSRISSSISSGVETTSRIGRRDRAKSLAKPVSRRLHRPLGHPQGSRRFRLRRGFGIAEERLLEPFEQRLLARPNVLVAEQGHDAVEQLSADSLFEEAFGGHRLRRFSKITPLGRFKIEPEATAVLRLASRPARRSYSLLKKPQGLEQKRPEPAAGAVGVLDVALLEQLREERLRQVVRFRRRRRAPDGERRRRADTSRSRTTTPAPPTLRRAPVRAVRPEQGSSASSQSLSGLWDASRTAELRTRIIEEESRIRRRSAEV